MRLDTKTIRRWLDPTQPVYHKDFAEAIEKLAEEVDTGRTKRGQLTVSQKHTLHRRSYEMVPIGPMRPVWSWPKRVLVRYASEVLGLDIAGSLAKADIEYEIRWELDAQTVTRRRPASSTVQEVDPNQDAVKVILRNLGDPERRWSLKDEIEGGPITSIEINYHEIEEDPNAGKKIENENGGNTS